MFPVVFTCGMLHLVPPPPYYFSLSFSLLAFRNVFLLIFFLQSFFYRSPMSVSSPSLFYFSLFLSSLFLSLHLPLHFCHFSSFLYQNLYFSRCFLLHLSDFLPPLPAFLRPSLFLSAYSLCCQILNFFRLLNLFFSFAFSSLQSIFYLIPWFSSYLFFPLLVNSSVSWPFLAYFALFFVFLHLLISLVQSVFFYVILLSCTSLHHPLLLSHLSRFFSSLVHSSYFLLISITLPSSTYNHSSILIISLFLSSLSFPWFRRALFPLRLELTWAHRRLLFSSLLALKQERCKATNNTSVFWPLQNLFLHKKSVFHYVVFLCFVFVIFHTLASKYSVKISHYCWNEKRLEEGTLKHEMLFCMNCEVASCNGSQF